ncbi:MAG TPA: hydroxyacylglutathione hydrolase [Methylomirabilota bacterium]|nr:hydroxyacylglutathione hydrolase [Methylomirabilota bacterium]
MLSSPLSWLLRSPERASRFAGAEGKPLQQGAVDARDVIAPGHALRISVIPTFRRHYAFLLHDRTSGDSAVVDPTDAGPIIGLARAQGWTIRHVIITHHHNAVGAAAIKRATRCTVHGPAAEADRIAAIDVAYQGGETFRLGNLRADVLAVPGHTVGHLAYWFSSAGVLFCGDTLSPLGCGRLSEGTPQEMWRSLALIRELPAETLIYSGFECSRANARFALAIDRDNLWLQTRSNRFDVVSAAGVASVPAKLEDEHVTNPFLRVDDPRIARAVGLEGASPVEVFTELRKRRDHFHIDPH